MIKEKFENWTKIDWPGNEELGYKCWVKGIGKKKRVYVGIGDFLTVCFSYGPYSHRSFSSTRWRPNGIVSELKMMEAIDSVNGVGDKFLKLNIEPDLPRYEVTHKYNYPERFIFSGEVADVSPSFQLRESAERVAKERNLTVKEIKPN